MRVLASAKISWSTMAVTSGKAIAEPREVSSSMTATPLARVVLQSRPVRLARPMSG